MIDYLAGTQQRLWDIFHKTVPNWTDLVKPGNEISYLSGPDVPSKRLMGNKQPGDYAEFAIRPILFTDQAFRSKAAQTLNVAGGGTCAYLTDETVTYEMRLAFVGLRTDKATALLTTMKAALYRSGPAFALKAPASPTAPGLSYVFNWGQWAGTFREEPNEAGSLRLVLRANLTVNYAFGPEDFSL